MSDKVGYKSPPKHSRFQKGASGNPSGRPKRPAPLHDDLQAELAVKVDVTEAGRARRFTKQQIVIKALIAKAAKGDPRAAAVLMSLRERGEAAAPPAAASAKLGPDDQKLLDDYVERQLRRRAAKTSGKP